MPIYYHPDDKQMLEKACGSQHLPPEIETMYGRMLRRKHTMTSHGGGPLGADTLNMILEVMQIDPPAEQAGPIEGHKVDWEDMYQKRLHDEGRVRIEAKYYDVWHAGRWIGIGEFRKLLIVLDSEPGSTREVNRAMVRLATQDPYEEERESRAAEREKPQARFEASMVKDEEPAQDSDESPEEDANHDPESDADYVADDVDADPDVKPPTDTVVDESTKVYKWQTALYGDEIYVERPDAYPGDSPPIENAMFMGVKSRGDDGCMIHVQLESGEEVDIHETCATWGNRPEPEPPAAVVAS